MADSFSLSRRAFVQRALALSGGAVMGGVPFVGAAAVDATAPGLLRPGRVRVAVTDLSAPPTGADRIVHSLEKILRVMRLAATHQVEVLLLPELALGGFNYNAGDGDWWERMRGNRQYAAALDEIQALAHRLELHTFFGGGYELGMDLFNVLYYTGIQTGRLHVARRKYSPPETMGSPAFSQGRPFDPALNCVQLREDLRIAALVCADSTESANIAPVLSSGANMVLISSAWVELEPATLRDFNILNFSKVNGFALMSNTRRFGNITRSLIAANGKLVVDHRPTTDVMMVADLDLVNRKVYDINQVIVKRRDA